MFSAAIRFFEWSGLPFKKQKVIPEETDASVKKRKALDLMVGYLRFERDPSIDAETQCDSTGVGTLSWTHFDNTKFVCNISPIMLMIREDTLRDFSNGQREYTVSQHGGVDTFPLRLKKLTEILRCAAGAAERAGFGDFPYKTWHEHTNDWTPTPYKEEGISEAMCSLADLLNIGRFTRKSDHNDDTIGNLAWFQDGKTVYCPITGVLDLIRDDKLFENDSDEHIKYIDDFGTLKLFPRQLRQLALHLEKAANASIDLNFLTIPDTGDDASEDEEDEDEEDEDEEDEDEEE